MKHWLESTFGVFLTLFAPVEAAIVAIIALALIDFVTGVWASIKEGQPITSARLRDTINKIIVYEIGVITAFLLEKYLLTSVIPVVKVVAAIIGVAEGKSIFENLDRIYGGSLFKAILDKLGSVNK